MLERKLGRTCGAAVASSLRESSRTTVSRRRMCESEGEVCHCEAIEKRPQDMGAAALTLRRRCTLGCRRVHLGIM